MITTYSNIDIYKKQGGIYYIINTITMKKYIGSTNNFYQRYRSHSRSSSCYDLKQDMLKYGAENFFFKIVDILEDTSTQNLEKIEQEHLNLYYAQEYILTERQDNRFRLLLYNRMPTASNKSLKSHSEETKRLWSIQRTGSKNSRYGVTLSEEQKQKVRNTYKEKYKNGYINPNQGKITTESTKSKVKEAWKTSGRVKNVYILNLRNKSISVCLGFNESSRLTKIDAADIGRICNKKQLYSKDYYFSFEEINDDNVESICQHILEIKENRKVRQKKLAGKVTSRWCQILLEDTLNSNVLVFETLKMCCKFLKTNRTTAVKYIQSQKLYKNVYKIKYYEDKNI